MEGRGGGVKKGGERRKETERKEKKKKKKRKKGKGKETLLIAIAKWASGAMMWEIS